MELRRRHRGTGGATQSHTYAAPGTYRVELSATGANGVTTVGTARVTVRASGAPPLDDEFSGNELDPRWEVLRPRLTGLNVADGALRLTAYGGDMHGGNASARNVLLQPLPQTEAVATTKIDVSGLTATGDQVGMIVWRSENPSSFAKVVFNRRGSTSYWFERSRSEGTGTTGGNSGAVNGPVPGTVYLRITSSGGANPTLTPESSLDGTTWSPVQGAFELPGTGPVKVGLTYFSGEALRVAAFDWFRVDGAEAQPDLFTTIGITRSETRANSQIYGNPTPYSLPAEEMPPSRTVGPAPNDEFDDVPLRMPDTSGSVPNLAKFQGQTLDLAGPDRKVYDRIHFFGMTSDGGPSGGNFTLWFSDGSTETINVLFKDWCAGPSDTLDNHYAIGRLSQRYRTSGGDGADCGIYHVPADIATNKILVAVQLPGDTSPMNNANTQSYLMALTLEEPGGFFEMPDLSGTVEFPDDQTAPTTTIELNPDAPPAGSDGWYRSGVEVTLIGNDGTGGSGVEQMMYRSTAARRSPTAGRSRSRRTASTRSSIGRSTAPATRRASSRSTSRSMRTRRGPRRGRARAGRWAPTAGSTAPCS